MVGRPETPEKAKNGGCCAFLDADSQPVKAVLKSLKSVLDHPPALAPLKRPLKGAIWGAFRAVPAGRFKKPGSRFKKFTM